MLTFPSMNESTEERSISFQNNLFLKNILVFLRVSCLHVCKCIMMVLGTCSGQKRALEPLKLDLQTL